MIYWGALLAAVLLSFERISYFWISHYPDAWRELCRRPALAALGGPVDVLRKLFYGFKALQILVFLGWCSLFSDGLIPWPTGTLPAFAAGAVLLAAGAALNLSVFYRLGSTGVFYGKQFGYDVPWINGFPFSVLKHPQYIGALISIWGFFLIMRFPHDDWFVLPVLETAYYAVGAYYEP
ncbi:MAG: hypothetical protein L0H73_02805 [Nitrococcus sp.]|nr:hypothetical protein [Nitrococcus sp.]